MKVETIQEIASLFARTALHFLWQGAVIAAVAGVVAMIVGNRSARFAYGAHLGALVLMALCIPITWMVLSSESTLVAAPVASGAEATPAADFSEISAFAESSSSSLVATARPFRTTVGPYLFGAYLVGVLFMFGRLLVALRGGRRLRRTAKEYDHPALASAARKLGIAKLPLLALSERVLVPIVVGVAKPAILLPAAALTRLTPAQLETVIAHELAHLRRFDHLVLLGQRVLEAVMFFHPAVWWISRSIDSARERCCDDLVLQVGAEPADYAESLVLFSEILEAERTCGGVAQLAVSGRGPSALKQRVLRILGHNDRSWLRINRPGIAIVVGAACCMMAFPIGLAIADRPSESGDEGKEEESGAHRQRFVPDERYEGKASWTRLTIRMGDKNPMLSAHISVGGSFPIQPAKGDEIWGRVRVLDGNDDAITLEIESPDSTKQKATLKRDKARPVTIGARKFQFGYPSSMVAATEPKTSPLTTILVTHRGAEPTQQPLKVSLEPVPNVLKFKTSAIRAKTGQMIELTFKNTCILPHNIVVIEPGSMAAVGAAADALIAAGGAAPGGFVPNHPKVIIATRMLNKGQSDTIRFTLRKKGKYPYICTFPGHWRIMRGEIIVE